MRNMYHILRQAVMVLSVLFLVTSSGETLAQNGWQQQIQNAQKAQLADEVTEDGRVLGKFQNRIFAVPATRLGITPRETSTSPAALATSWSPQKQSAINADIEKLASGASSGSGTAAKGEPVKVASVPTQSRTDATRAARGGGQEPPANKAQEGSVAAKRVNKAPDFVVSPGGTAFPMPKGATGPTPVVNPSGNQTGAAFTGGAGGANGQVSTMRIMNQAPAKGNSPGYPNGYIKYENSASPKPQGVDPYSGKTLPNSQSHFPID